MIYTALGDSITFGEKASTFNKAYPQLVVSALKSRHNQVAGYVLAHPGWSSYDLLDAVNWQGASMIRHSTVISIWVGGVDLANAAILSLRSQKSLPLKQITTTYMRNLTALITNIKKCNPRIICCTQYNPFPNSPIAIEWINRLNHMTTEVALRNHVNIAPVHRWFQGEQAHLIYGYHQGKIEDAWSSTLPIHPNNRGHQLIATKLTPYIAGHLNN